MLVVLCNVTQRKATRVVIVFTYAHIQTYTHSNAYMMNKIININVSVSRVFCIQVVHGSSSSGVVVVLVLVVAVVEFG